MRDRFTMQADGLPLQKRDVLKLKGNEGNQLQGSLIFLKAIQMLLQKK